MRDVVLLAMLLIAIPLILRRPWVGVIVWVVVSVMNPHRLGWGFMYDFPVGYVVALTTLASVVFSRERKRFPVNSVTLTLILFVVWMNVTLLFALHPEAAFTQWVKVMKIMFMLMIGMAILHTRQHLTALIWAIVVSLGFYGVKGGIFALTTGGSYKIWGPPGSDVGDNNAIAFALVVIFPLMYYLSTSASNKWIKFGLRLAMVLCALSILTSHSRGAFLALAAMATFLVLKSEKRVALGLAVGVLAALLLAFMPESWLNRMETIKTYEQDASSMGRINAWWMAVNLANDRPLVGGGFDIYYPDVFALWAPNPADVHAAHSLYFAALGEHGYVGLFLFLAFCLFAWRTGTVVAKMTKGKAELGWAASLGRMLQVSMVGYAVGGAFLSVLYFDVFYYVVALMVLLREIVSGDSNATQGKASIQQRAREERSLSKPRQPGPLGSTTNGRSRAVSLDRSAHG